MIDIYVPEGALPPAAEAAVIAKITDVLIRHEGFDPTNPVVRNASWVFLHRPSVFVAGAPAETPRYKVVVSVPEGQLDAKGRAGVVAEVTEALLDAENGAWPRDPGRVWVFPTEVPEGHWGGGGNPAPLASILMHLGGYDEESARELAGTRLAASRADRAALSQ